MVRRSALTGRSCPVARRRVRRSTNTSRGASRVLSSEERRSPRAPRLVNDGQRRYTATDHRNRSTERLGMAGSDGRGRHFKRGGAGIRWAPRSGPGGRVPWRGPGTPRLGGRRDLLSSNTAPPAAEDGKAAGRSYVSKAVGPAGDAPWEPVRRSPPLVLPPHSAAFGGCMHNYSDTVLQAQRCGLPTTSVGFGEGRPQRAGGGGRSGVPLPAGAGRAEAAVGLSREQVARPPRTLPGLAHAGGRRRPAISRTGHLVRLRRDGTLEVVVPAKAKADATTA